VPTMDWWKTSSNPPRNPFNVMSTKLTVTLHYITLVIQSRHDALCIVFQNRFGWQFVRILTQGFGEDTKRERERDWERQRTKKKVNKELVTLKEKKFGNAQSLAFGWYASCALLALREIFFPIGKLALS
jgi:hypothetical protein